MLASLLRLAFVWPVSVVYILTFREDVIVAWWNQFWPGPVSWPGGGKLVILYGTNIQLYQRYAAGGS